jgi:prepilin-type N-terminal cleavage/methylation domain-containing protein
MSKINQAGFSLLEVLCALALLSLAMLLVARYGDKSLQLAQNSFQTTQALAGYQAAAQLGPSYKQLLYQDGLLLPNQQLIWSSNSENDLLITTFPSLVQQQHCEIKTKNGESCFEMVIAK